jgi:outer membrane protein OmpA-like peptidoglycan-associated protein
MQAMRGMMLAMIGLLLAAGADAQPAAAQSKNEIIKTLVPARSPTRGISVEPASPAVAGLQKDLPKINLTITFESDSDRLTLAGQKLLDELGAALQDPSLKSFRFLIVGHTDGAGPELYNQQLSERRAAAVKAYLVSKSQIEEARLTAVGFGKSRLLDAGNPMSAENRRVEIINLLN